MSSEEVIAVLQKYPSLWNLKHLQYHNRLVADRLWDKVADELQLPKSDVKSKWRNLRDQFNKEYKKIPTPRSGASAHSSPIYKGKWPHFQAMMFLKDVDMPHATVSSLDTDTTEAFYEEPQEEFVNDVEDTVLEEELSESILSVQTSQTPRPQNSETPTIQTSETPRAPTAPKTKSTLLTPVYVVPDSVHPPKKKLKIDVNALSNFEAEMLKSVCAKLDLLKQPEDDDMNFFKSLLPFFKSMSPVQKLKIRSKIQKVVIEELENCEISYNTSACSSGSVPK